MTHADTPRIKDQNTLVVSDRVMAEIHHLTKDGAVTVDGLLRRLLHLENDCVIPQDGTIGYRDPGTGLVLPEGFEIQRRIGDVTHRATASGGGFVTADGTVYANLNRLNVSLGLTRRENAWDHWRFDDGRGRLQRLAAIRPIPKKRRRSRGLRIA